MFPHPRPLLQNKMQKLVSGLLNSVSGFSRVLTGHIALLILPLDKTGERGRDCG